MVLQARIDTAVALIKAGKADTLIMSGDNSRANYDEVSAMKAAAVEGGVSTDRVLLDYAGFRTLDSCIRVRKVFGQRSVLVVSQGFHLPRAVHLCRSAGVDAIGVEAADPRGTSWRVQSGIREIPAAAIAWAEARLGRNAKFLGPAIDIDNPPPEALVQPLSTVPGVSTTIPG